MAVANNKKLDWLPPGWKVEDKVKNGRKVRHFINVKSAKRFYSKAAVLRYIRNARMKNQRSQLMNGLVRTSPRNKQTPLLKEPNDSPEGLPPGWITEVRTRKSGPKAGGTYKCFIDPSTGKTFYSIPEVLRYLKETQPSADSTGRKKNDASVDCSVNDSARVLRHHKPDPVRQGPSLEDSARVLRHHEPDPVRKDSARVLRHHKPDPVRQAPSLEDTARVLRSHKPDPVQQAPSVEDSAHVLRHHEPDPVRKDSTRVLRHHKPDPVRQAPSLEDSAPVLRHHKPDPVHQAPSLEGSACVLRHHKPDPVRQAPSLEDSAGVSRHHKLDPVREVPSLEGSAGVLRHDKPDPMRKVPQHLKSHEGKREPMKKRKVMVETVIDEGLPPGWIKEIRIKKSRNGVRKDPFYFDPTTGYVFRSRLEVLRYLETGEISRHAYKRKDSGENSLQSTEGGVSPSASAVRSKAAEGTTKKRLFTGKGNAEGSCDPGNSIVGTSDGVSAGNNVLLALRADLDRLRPMEAQEAKGNKSNTVQMHSMSGHNEDIGDMNKQVLPEACDMDGSQNKAVPVDTKPRGSERNPKRNRKERVLPCRSSKRLAGVEVEPVTNSVAIERVLRSTSKKSDKSEAIPSLGSKPCESSQEAPPMINEYSQEEIFPTAYGHPENQATQEALRSIFGDEIIKEPTSTCTEGYAVIAPSRNIIEKQRKKGPSRIGAKRQTKIKPSRSNIGGQMIEEASRMTEGQTIKLQMRNNDDQTIKQPPTMERPITYEETRNAEINRREREQQDSQFSFPWSDPCIEFAFKTLTGALPLDDNLAIDDYVQHQIRTSADSSNNVILTDDGPPGFCQKNGPLQFDTSRQQQPTNSAVSRTQQSQPIGARSRNYFQHQIRTSAGSGNNVILSDDGPPGFCQTNVQLQFDSFRQQSPANSSVPRTQQSQPADARTHNYVQHQIRTSADSSNNIILSDDGPPGFCKGNVPLQSDASRKQQPTKAAVPHTPESQPADTTLEKTNMFSPQNRNYFQHQICTSADRSSNVTLSDAGPPGFSPNDLTLQFGASRQQRPTNSAVPRTQRSQATDAIAPKTDIFSPHTRSYFQPQIGISADSSSNVTLSDAGPPGFRPNDLTLQFGASRQQQPTKAAVPRPQQSQPADASLTKTNMFSPQNHNYFQHQICSPADSSSNVTLSDVGPPGFSPNDLTLHFGASMQQRPTNSAAPHTQSQATDAIVPKTDMFSHQNHNYNQHQMHTSAGSSSNVTLQMHTSAGSSSNVTFLDAGPPGFCQNVVSLQFSASRQQQLTNSALHHTQQSQPASHKTNIFSPQNPNFLQHQFHTSADSTNNFTLPDVGPPGFCLNEVPFLFGASSQQQPTNPAVPHTPQSQPADATLQKGNMFSPFNRY